MATTASRTTRSKVALTKRHLTRLSKIAAADHEDLYARRPDYRGQLIAVVLAQGGGQHYLDRRNGVKDLDVWSFFALPPSESRFPEDRRKRHVDFGPSDLGRQRYVMAKARSPRELALWTKWHREHQGRRVDLMMRGLPCAPDDDPAAAIRDWLDRGIRKPNSSPGYLRRKGVILIDPPDRRGEVIWEPANCDAG
ncbi:hypothetical protein [Nocardioides panaciterrulae]|uniref:Uncharacterized protein n=1 Tax=Nocardioides panaciterrulae TaxID=661492 RepID=A0A7Y9E335_9ACTN|nr:hypothetical protein [Nocardioides panaciterrulae]NYD40036.1 hypothetical protein [Nocardioides panaciterrulae]